MFESVYIDHLKGKKVLLETPTGFAVFLVKDFAFKQAKDIWVHFSDPQYAIQALVALGFKKFDNRSIARNRDAGPGRKLEQLIKKFCKTGETLIVQDMELKASIEKKIDITCKCDGYAVGEVIWGIKNVLHAFIREEEHNITPEYCLPVSKGLQEALQYYLVNIPPEMVDKSFITKFGFLRYLEMNLEDFPKELSRSFDEYVGICGTIEDGLDYAKVLAMVLVPELVEEHDFSKTFCHDLASKLHQAQLFQAKRKDYITMHDVEKIMGYLHYLLHVPELRDKILMDVKHMEATLFESFISQKMGLDAVQRVNVGEPVNFNEVEYKRVLLETPSGFAIFNVRRDVFRYPEHIWTWFTDTLDTRKIASLIGFVSVDEKSVTRSSDIGPGDKLKQLILRFCNAKRELVVQDTQLKAVIESKLDVKCWTGDQVVEDVIWGLKYRLCDFISEETNKITDNYILPLSKQLLGDLKTYGINVSTSEITADLINVFGDVKILDNVLEIPCKALRNKCDCYVSEIVVSEDNVTYASMIAKVLVPEFEEELGLPEIAGGLGSKLLDLPKDVGKAIDNCDKEEIRQSLKRISDICRQRKCAYQELRTIETQIGVARMAIGNEAVGKDDEPKTNTKGSNRGGGSSKKCETEGNTGTVGSNKDDRFANNCDTKPMEDGRSANKGKTGKTVSKAESSNLPSNRAEQGGLHNQSVPDAKPSCPGEPGEEQAAVKAQAAFRGYVARRSFRTLKGIIRLQALIRGHLVRRQAVATLRTTWLIVKFQALVRGRNVRLSGTDMKFSLNFGQNKFGGEKSSDAWKEKLSSNVYVRKLLSSPISLEPLHLRYEKMDPYSVYNWLERWTISRIWKPVSQQKRVTDGKPQVRKVSYAMETESAKLKRNAWKRNAWKGSAVTVEGLHTSMVVESEELKRNQRRNQRKFSSPPSDSVPDSQLSELEKVKRNLRNATNSMAQASKLSSARADSSKVSDSIMEDPKVSNSVVEVSKTPSVMNWISDHQDIQLQSTHEASFLLGTQEQSVNGHLHSDIDNFNLLPGLKIDLETPLQSVSIGDNVDEPTVRARAVEVRLWEEYQSNGSLRTSKRKSSFSNKLEHLENGTHSTPVQPRQPSYMAATESSKAKLRAQNSEARF